MDPLDNFYTDHIFVDGYKQRRTNDILSIFKKDRFLDLIIINFENIASHKYAVQNLRVYEWLDQK